MQLPGGRMVRGRKFSADVGIMPQWGLYALWREPSTAWPHGWIRWSDFGLPLDNDRARTLIGQAYERSKVERVEVGCGGGRGRTGTILAALVMLDGLDAASAVASVREHYDHGAVETPWQRHWLAGRFWENSSTTND